MDNENTRSTQGAEFSPGFFEQQETKTHTTPIPQEVTRPQTLLRHEISDEELTMLSSYNKDYLLEAIWGCIGAAVGFLIPTIEAIKKAYFSSQTGLIEFIDLVQIILFSVAVIIAGVIFFIRKNSNKSSTKLVDEIRNRSKTVG